MTQVIGKWLWTWNGRILDSLSAPKCRPHRMFQKKSICFIALTTLLNWHFLPIWVMVGAAQLLEENWWFVNAEHSEHE